MSRNRSGRDGRCKSASDVQRSLLQKACIMMLKLRGAPLIKLTKKTKGCQNADKERGTLVGSATTLEHADIVVADYIGFGIPGITIGPFEFGLFLTFFAPARCPVDELPKEAASRLAMEAVLRRGKAL